MSCIEGSDSIDQILTVLCSTSMFVGAVIAAILDNTVPGNAKERGMLMWHQHHSQADETSLSSNDNETYDFPCGMGYIRKWTCTKKIPVCPTFNGWSRTKSNSRPKSDEDVTKF